MHDASGSLYSWEFERDGREFAVNVDGPLIFNDAAPMIQAASAGPGVANVLEDQAAPRIAIGGLVPLLQDCTPSFPGYFRYYPSRDQTPLVLAAFIAALPRRRAQ